MNYLIVAAHPDDEVLGAGATIRKLTSAGQTVDICIMSSEARARANRPSDVDLNGDMDACIKLLCARKIYAGEFPNIEINTSPHLKVVQFIEEAIIDSSADIIITHHPADTNNDHLQTSLACQAAIRLFQRRSDVKAISELWFMEVPSSTEWSTNSALNRFQPNTFVEIGLDGIEAKITALSQYRGIMHEYPHPRSNEALKGLAAYRGSQAGLVFAEAFECVFRRIASGAI
jgi:LmbE family N-acetylglucosaminyl deacetylase